MARTAAIGVQDFEQIIQNDYFYVDKTAFIREWWESGDTVTLITRPRRFGKTLNMNMLQRFFSVKYAGRGEIFKELSIWKEQKYRALQGTYPVIFLSFADVKEQKRDDAVESIKSNLVALYNENRFLLEENFLNPMEQEQFASVTMNMSDVTAAKSVRFLCSYLSKYYKQKVIILLDEYDTPLQEAFVNGYWEELVAFTRALLNNTFKTNPYMERALMTGITRISRESLFSDLNNLKVVTAVSDKYASCFGFTEEEVFAAMDEFGLNNKEEVKRWYDGFTVGRRKDIYNPWSILNYLDEKKLKPYWANTSSNTLIGTLLQKAGKNIKIQFEDLLHHRSVVSEMEEEIVFNQLENDENAIWSLLLAVGYLKLISVDEEKYEFMLTNYEVEKMFSKIIKAWFRRDSADYNDFIKALLIGDVDAMGIYMNRISMSVFSFFDGGKQISQTGNPERFYHGFVLGLLVELVGRYVITSNRESGFGRYDVMMQPLDSEDDGIILEFKVRNPKTEKNLQETVQAALRQIEEKQYAQMLLEQGVARERIRKYGFAFEGKTVLIG